MTSAPKQAEEQADREQLRIVEVVHVRSQLPSTAERGESGSAPFGSGGWWSREGPRSARRAASSSCGWTATSDTSWPAATKLRHSLWKMRLSSTSCTEVRWATLEAPSPRRRPLLGGDVRSRVNLESFSPRLESEHPEDLGQAIGIVLALLGR